MKNISIRVRCIHELSIWGGRKHFSPLIDVGYTTEVTNYPIFLFFMMINIFWQNSLIFENFKNGSVNFKNVLNLRGLCAVLHPWLFFKESVTKWPPDFKKNCHWWPLDLMQRWGAPITFSDGTLGWPHKHLLGRGPHAKWGTLQFLTFRIGLQNWVCMILYRVDPNFHGKKRTCWNFLTVQNGPNIFMMALWGPPHKCLWTVP